jgi:predicted Zn-dependent peptidase
MTKATNSLYQTHQLSNGLQIVGQSMPDFESVALCFYVRTGACDEEDARVAGISHFLEHMIFKGTKTLGWQELKQAFTRIGLRRTALLQSTIPSTISVCWGSTWNELWSYSAR